MIGAVVLVTDVIFKAPTVIPMAIAITALFGTLWFGYATVRRLRGDRSW